MTWNRERTLTQTGHAAQFPVEGDQWGENAGALTGNGTEDDKKYFKGRLFFISTQIEM